MMRRGFSLIELAIALGLGLMVALIAVAGFRVAAATIAQTNRLAFQNRLMRVGLVEALEEIDFWTRYDDPLAPDPAQRAPTTIAPGTFTGNLHAYSETSLPFAGRPLGGPWTPLRDMPLPPSDTVPAGKEQVWTVGTGLPSAAALADTREPASAASYAAGIRGQAWGLDLERGWDPRPYQANDPRRWGRVPGWETPYSHKRFGRYAMLSNLHKEPVLGWGDDPRIMQSWGSRDFYDTASYGGYGPAWKHDGAPGPGGQVVTGPYGPYAGYTAASIPSRTWTWLANQIHFLQDALGNQGMCDYLPSGTAMQHFGTQGRWPAGQAMVSLYHWGAGTAYRFGPATAAKPVTITLPGASGRSQDWCRIDERLSFSLSAVRDGANYSDTPFFNISSASLNASRSYTYPLLPFSPYSGAWVVGISNLGDSVPNTALTPAERAKNDRKAWPGSREQVFTVQPLINRMTTVQPLLPQRPPGWPNLQLSVHRVLSWSHFAQQVRIRWTDKATGQVAELGLNGIGTTLRGARQQRRPDRGWAAWFAPDDPRNDPTLDSPPP